MSRQPHPYQLESEQPIYGKTGDSHHTLPHLARPEWVVVASVETGQPLVAPGRSRAGMDCKIRHNGVQKDAELSGVADTLEGRDASQRDLDRLERGACANFTFNAAKCEVPHVG